MIEDQLNEALIHEEKQKMGIPKRKLVKLLKIGSIVCVLAILIIFAISLSTGREISTIIGVIQFNQASSIPALNNVKYNKDSKTLTFTDHELKQDYLNINIQYDMVHSQRTFETECQSQAHSPDSEKLVPEVDLPSKKCPPQLNLEFGNGLNAVIYETDLDGTLCHSVQWHSTNISSEITNCFILEDNWYGGGGLSIQKWPLNRVNVPLQPHITQKLNLHNQFDNSEETRFDSFIEPYFVSGKGAAVLFEHYLPLFISMNHYNDKKLCFTSAFKQPYASVNADDKLVLKYLVCKERTAKSMHRHMLKTLKVPFFQGTPVRDLIRKPIWSTRGLGNADINEAQVLSLVNEIKSYNLPYSHLFIDGNYSRSRGNFFFNENKFPHSHQLIMELNSPGENKFPVGTEIFPHISSHESKLFAIQYKNNSASKYNQEQAYFLDVTNEEAVKWYKSHLIDLTEQISLKGFRFSGGYAKDIVNGADESFLKTNKTMHNLNLFTKKFAEIASELKINVLLGSGYKSQIDTFIADAGPMLSSWEHNKGLKSVIPTVLTYGLMGYPFGLVGPIGGINISGGELSGRRGIPDKELYIRWFQLMTYLPIMELSIGPWVYGQEVMNYTVSLLNFRYSELWPKLLLSAVEEAIKLGIPIARPLWWIAPEDKIAQFIDCEFFLGNSLLVAPVLYADARFRDVYLPDGSWWRDQLRGQLYEGGQWLRRYKVGLYEIATFKRDINPRP